MLDFVREFLDHPEWRYQHRWRKAIWNNLNRFGLTGLHTLPMNRRWVDIHRRAMPLINLDPAMAGFKIVQISDLHYSPLVWRRYLIQYIRWVNEIQPDLVVITGDLITGGYRFAHRIATILMHLQARHGVICTLGNHDYSIYGKSSIAEGDRRADFLAKCLRDRGLICLRNQSLRVLRQGACVPITLVGLDDEWSNHLNADLGFSGVGSNEPTICLNHNPANVKALMKYPWQWMLAGHTHGRQLVGSRFGRTFYPKKFRHYTHGYYNVEGRHLYVNRGLSYGQRKKNWCRPEITVFKLEVEAMTPIRESNVVSK